MARRSGSPFYVRRDYGGSAPRFARRTAGGILTVSWDLEPMVRMAQAIKGEAGNADTAIRGAHEEAAERVASFAQEVLEKKVRARGREQKPSKYLEKAIKDERNRESDLRGFSVGYLDRIEEIQLYWRRIEEGSDTQVGDVFYGMFQNAGGKWRWPSSNEADWTDLRLIRFHNVSQRDDEEDGAKSKTPVVRIRNEIKAYNFLAEGFQQWGIKDGAWTQQGLNNMIGTYVDHFERVTGRGSFFARWFARFGTGTEATRPTRTYGSLPPGSVEPGSF